MRAAVNIAFIAFCDLVDSAKSGLLETLHPNKVFGQDASEIAFKAFCNLVDSIKEFEESPSGSTSPMSVD